MWPRKKRRCAVFGAGPAGLLAAYAAKEAGYDVQVFSAPSKDSHGQVAKSLLFGCQYLHRPIPEVTASAGKAVAYALQGSVEDYRRKVYGDQWEGRVSPDEYGPETGHYAWNLRQAYDRLWDWAQSMDMLVSCRLTPEAAHPLYADQSLTIISTIPALAMCRHPEDHKFLTQDIWAMGETDHDLDSDDRALPYRAPDMSVVCNGEDAPRWYRAATVFGYSTLEWPQGAKPPITGVAAVRKPLSTDCDCYTQASRWYRAGRYGRWTKGVLVDTAYYDTLEALA